MVVWALIISVVFPSSPQPVGAAKFFNSEYECNLVLKEFRRAYLENEDPKLLGTKCVPLVLGAPI